jgi:RNA polymerase sigma-70 factor (ECF subfamily)
MERAAVPGMIREQKLNQWIEDYSDSILRTCFLYLSDQTQAEDATQDTWIKAWKHMDDFERKGIANEKAWLLRIAINTCKDYRRTAWFRHVDRSKALDELPPQLIAVEPEDRTLTLMVMDLPDRYKQVILLHFFQGLTMQETADALGASQSTVHRRLKKAEEMLREHPEMSVAEIADSLGFNTQNYFCRRFKEQYGVPPTHYRKKF